MRITDKRYSGELLFAGLQGIGLVLLCLNNLAYLPPQPLVILLLPCNEGLAAHCFSRVYVP